MDDDSVHEVGPPHAPSIDPRTIRIGSTCDPPSSLVPTPVPSDKPSNIPALSVQAVSHKTFILDQAQAIGPVDFPNPPPRGSTQVPATIPNVNFLLQSYSILVHYNVISKKIRITVPGLSGAPDNLDNVAMTQIMSLATLNGMPTGLIANIVEALADRNQYNPVAEWIGSKPWDGQSRLQAFYDTLEHRSDFMAPLKEELMFRWLIGAVAAALMPSGFRGRGVLTVQGPQSIGKTAWVSALIPDPVLRESVIKLDHHLDAHNKDSIIAATSHWIVEIGELDSSFKKDVARLKGFLTNDRDKLRKPYARAYSEYPRKTVFIASVNEGEFLVDSTGNTRWWVIPVTKVNYQHGIDMQQLFAEVAVAFHKGEPWWLERSIEACLERENRHHRTASVIREKLLEKIDLDRVGESDLVAKSSTEMLQVIDIDSPTNTQHKECNAVLRELLGEPKKHGGTYKWRVPFKKASSKTYSSSDSDDLY